jgi:hypothetical protein
VSDYWRQMLAPCGAFNRCRTPGCGWTANNLAGICAKCLQVMSMTAQAQAVSAPEPKPDDGNPAK